MPYNLGTFNGIQLKTVPNSFGKSFSNNSSNSSTLFLAGKK